MEDAFAHGITTAALSLRGHAANGGGHLVISSPGGKSRLREFA